MISKPPSETLTSHSLRNSDFPNTHISRIDVSLDDPDHQVTLTWTGPLAAEQKVGPFRSSPGAGLKGLNCDDVATSQKSGSLCTPKGHHVVQGFARHLNDDHRATHVTWFEIKRSIALHYFPEVPSHAASHGCVRLESDRVAQLIYDNSVVNSTEVVVGGTWTKPALQWPRK